MDSVELYVRLTARLSAVVFAAALFLFAARNARRYAIPVLAAFVGVHSVHFATVLWLAALSGGANIRDRGGWAVVLIVATVFYAASIVVLRSWRRVLAGSAPTAAARTLTHVSVAAIWLIFMNSYVGRIPRNARFAIPAGVLTAALLLYLRSGAARARRAPAAVE